MIENESINIEEDFLRKVGLDKLHDVLLRLKLSEQELIHKLCLNKQIVTQTEYATRNNRSYVALRKYLERLVQKLKVVIR